MPDRENSFRLEQAAVRLVSAPPLYSREPMNSPAAAIRVMAKELKSYDREVVCVVNLNKWTIPINFSIISMETLDCSIVSPREFLKHVFLSNAAGVILIHNHPGGSLSPSREDIRLTDRMMRLCQMTDIRLFDHIIIAAGNDETYFSFHENNILETGNIQYAEEMEDLRWENIPERRGTTAAEPNQMPQRMVR